MKGDAPPAPRCACSGAEQVRPESPLLWHGSRVTCTRCGRRTFSAAWVTYVVHEDVCDYPECHCLKRRTGHICRHCLPYLEGSTT